MTRKDNIRADKDYFGDILTKFIERAKPMILPIKDNPEMSRAIREHIWDEGPGVVKNGAPPTPAEQRFFDLFKALIDVSKSLEIMGHVPIYINSFPFKKVDKSDYLRYHVGAYLQEVYIFKCRLFKFLSLVSRGAPKNIKLDIEKFKKLLEASLDGILRTRGTHVHFSPYSEKDLDRLSTLDLLVSSGDLPPLKTYRDRVVLAEFKKKWIDTIRKNNKTLRELSGVALKSIERGIFETRNWTPSTVSE